MREIRPSGSEGGGAAHAALLTPIEENTLSPPLHRRFRRVNPRRRPPPGADALGSPAMETAC